MWNTYTVLYLLVDYVWFCGNDYYVRLLHQGLVAVASHAAQRANVA